MILFNPAFYYFDYSKKEASEILECYFSREFNFKKIIGTCNPLDVEMPYFRQILLGKNYLLVGNSFALPYNGVIKAYGNPKFLSELLEIMFEVQIKPVKNWKKHAIKFANSNYRQALNYKINDKQLIKKLLKRNALIKVMKGYMLIVGPDKDISKKNNSKYNDEGCFTDDIKLVVGLVKDELERKTNSKQENEINLTKTF
jgi:hypothetical protein